MEYINEVIGIEVVFREGKVIPVRLVWRGREIKISGVGLKHEGKEGSTPLLYFSLTGNGATYGVVWNKKTDIWRMLEVSVY